MYQPEFDNNIDDEELSALENFVSLNDLINSGGIKSERAHRILNQFSSNSNSKISKVAHNQDSISSSNNFKRPKYTNNRRFKS